MIPERAIRFLPELYRDPSALDPAQPLGCLLSVMHQMHQPVERLVETMGEYVDPYRAPPDFVFMLADWLGLHPFLHVRGARRNSGKPHFAAGLFNLRALVVEAAWLARSRGTEGVLERFLEVATGQSGFHVEHEPVDADGMPRPYHIRVSVPAADGALRELIRTIVTETRPAFVTFDLVFSTAGAEAAGTGNA